MTVSEIRRALDRASRPADDLSNDQAEADRVVAALQPLTRIALYAVLAAAGLDGIRSHDSKGYLLTRIRMRLTARLRLRERTEV